MDQPRWFQQLAPRGGIHTAALNENRKQIPDFTGCYVFTVGKVPITPGRVLYVGEAAGQPLRARLANYLVDFHQRKKREGHKGKGFVLEARHRSDGHSIFSYNVSWWVNHPRHRQRVPVTCSYDWRGIEPGAPADDTFLDGDGDQSAAA